MKDKYSNIKTFTTSQSWKDKSEEDRIKLIHDELKKNSLYENFEVTKAPSNGQIVLKIEQIIPADKRGLLLLELEKILKSSVDEGITVWCEPVGDKSKLRNLRGVQIKA